MSYKQHESPHIYKVSLSNGWNEDMGGNEWEKEAHLTPKGELPQPYWEHVVFYYYYFQVNILATSGTELGKKQKK